MRKWAPSLAWTYALILYGFIFLPVIMLVLFSFQETMFPVPPFNGPSLRWYRTALADPRLTSALANSLVLAISTSLIAVLLGFLAAYGLARYRLPGGNVIRGLITAPLMMSYLIIGMGLNIMFNG